MKNSRIFRALFFIVLVPALLLGDFGQIFTYQGKLTDASGVPQEDPVNMTFAIYDAAAAGVLVWTKDVAGVDPVHGLFSVELDISTGTPPYTSMDWDSYSALWLQVTVAGTPLMPREKLTSAFNALNVADDAVNENKIDWGLAAGEVSAVDVPIEDVGTYYTATDVEGALQEVGLSLSTIDVTLQDAYDGGNAIDVAASTPVQITATGSGNRALDVTAGAERALQVINSGADEALYVRNDGSGPAIFSSGDLQMSGTAGTKIYSNADVNIMVDENDDVEVNDFNILNPAATAVFTVYEDGAVTITDTLEMSAQRITGVADPTEPQDAATKAYVDAASSDDQDISGSNLSGTDLFIGIENGTGETIDLSTIISDDQDISGSNLSGNDLFIGIENGTGETIDLSTIISDDQDISGSNLSGTDLFIGIENGTGETIDLSTIISDDQTDAEVPLTDWTPDLIYVTESGDVHSAIGQLDAAIATAGDDWGSQAVEITARLTGDGTVGDELDIAQQAATSGQVLKWDGSAWTPADDVGASSVNLQQAYDAGNTITTTAGVDRAVSISVPVAGTGTALYLDNDAGGNAIWSDANIFANGADVIVKEGGAFKTQDSDDSPTGSWTAASGDIWTSGDLYTENNFTIYSKSTGSVQQNVFTPINGTDNTILRVGPGNNFYIQDNGAANIAQFADGTEALYLYGNLHLRDNRIIHDGAIDVNQTYIGFIEPTHDDNVINFPDASGTVALTSDITDDQDISGSNLSGTDLFIGIEDGTGETVDLGAFMDNTDDQNISGSNLVGSILTIGIESGTNETVDLSTISSDDQDISGSNLSGTDLFIGIEDGAGETVDLGAFMDNTDDQNISGSNLVGSVLTIGIESGANETVDLSSLGGHTEPSNTYDFRGSVAPGSPDPSWTGQMGTEIQPKVDILVYQAYVCWGNEYFRIWRNSDEVLLIEVDLSGVTPGSWQTVDFNPPILLTSGVNYTITCRNDVAADAYSELSAIGPPDETYVTYVLGRSTTGGGTGFPDNFGTVHPLVDIKFFPGSSDDQNISGSNLTGNILTIGIEDGSSEAVDLSSLVTGSLTSILTYKKIYIGDASDVASEQTLHGDAIIDETGLLTIQDYAVDGSDIALGGDTGGDIMYYDGTEWTRLPGSASDDYVLAYNTTSNEPYWKIDDAGGSVDGGGTLNKVPKWTPDGNTLGDSRITDDGVVLNPVEVDADLTTTGNLVVEGNYITFGNGETIDNNDDGIITITGESKVTGQLGVNGLDPFGTYGINVQATDIGGRGVNIITNFDGASGVYSATGGKFTNTAFTAITSQVFDGVVTNNKYGYYGDMAAYANAATQTVNNYGAYLIADGATGAGGGTTNNYALYASASGGDANYAGYFDGNILVKGFYYAEDGDAGTPGQVLASTATGTDWIDAASGLVNPGTNGAVAYYSGVTTISPTALGVTGQALISGNTGVPTWWTPTQGSVVFAGVGGILEQDNANLFWHNANKMLGIGTDSPQLRLHVNKNGSGHQKAIMISNTNPALVDNGASAVFAANRTTGGLTEIASIEGFITDIADATYKGALIFSTADGGAPAEQMRINHEGNVGIGTSTPGTHKLYINGKAYVETPITTPSGPDITAGDVVSTDFLNGETSMEGGTYKIYTYRGNGGAASGGGGGSGAVSNGFAHAIAYYPVGGTTVDDLPTGSANQIIMSGGAGADPYWSTPTYPNTATSGRFLVGDGTNIQLSAYGFPSGVGGIGTILRSDGTNWVASDATYPNNVAQGDILYGSAEDVLSTLPDVVTGNALISGGVGVAPSWGKIGLTTHVTGTLPVANGGTSRTTLTSNGILYGNGVAAVGMTAAGGDGQVLSTVSGTPTWTSGGSNGQVLTKSTTGLPTWTTISTGGTPGGADTYVQYNDGGSFGGEADFAWDHTNNKLNISVPGYTSSNVNIDGGANALAIEGDGSWQCGGRLTFGDPNNCYIEEPADDYMKIYAPNGIQIYSGGSDGNAGDVLYSGGTYAYWAPPASGAGDVIANATRTTNYLTKWTNSGTKEIGNSQIYDNGTNVGIGTGAPTAKLDVSGAVRIRGGGTPAADKVLTATDASGNAVWGDVGSITYGSNIQYQKGTYDISMNSATFTDVPQMSLTFTPKHDVVLVFFTISGWMDLSSLPQTYADVRIMKDGVVQGGGNAIATDLDDCFFSGASEATSFCVSITLPIVVTPGVSTTIKAQWRRDGINPGVMYNNPASSDNYNSRCITILD